MSKKINYWAFISYSHQDSAWCNWLHKKLESYRIPKPLRSKKNGIGKQLYPIFRDRDELPSSTDLGANISDALVHSKALLVICSPSSAQSLWVNEEIINYQKLSPGKKIIALLINGESENSDAENYCFPPAMRELLENNNTLLIDARTDGKSDAVKLNILSELIDQPNDAVIRAHKQNRIQHRILLLIGSFLLLTISWFGLIEIQKNRLRSTLVKSEQLADMAHQKFKAGQDGQALTTLSKSLPLNTVEPEKPVNEKARLLLNKIMTKPLIKIERGDLKQEISELRPTNNNNLWLIKSTDGKLRLFDLSTGEFLWTLNDTTIMAFALNDEDKLIVRSQNKMQNYDLDTLKLNCELELTTEANIPPQGQLSWLQKNWFTELTGKYFDNKIYIIQHVQFVDSRKCSISDKSNFNNFYGFGLVDVLTSSNGKDSFIVVFDMFKSDKDNKKAINIYQLWSQDSKIPPKPLFHIHGSINSHIKNATNNFLVYRGPIIRTHANKPISFFAKQISDTNKYELIRYDWEKAKITNKQPLPGFPKAIYWHNSEQTSLTVVISNVEESFSTQVRLFDTNQLTPIKFPKTKMPHHSISPSGKYLIGDNLNTYWFNFDTEEHFNLSFRQPVQLKRQKVIDWIDNKTAIYANKIGKIYSIHENNVSHVVHLDNKDCCKKILDSDLRLITGYEGQLFELKDKKIKLIFKAKTKDVNYRLLSPQYILATEASSDNQLGEDKSFSIIDIHSKHVVFQVVEKMRDIEFSSKFVTIKTKNQLKIVHYNQSDKPLLITFPKDTIASKLNSDATILTVITHTLYGGDGFSHVHRINIANGNKLSQIKYKLGSGFMIKEKFFIFPEKNSIIFYGSFNQNEQKSLLKIGTSKEEIINLGESAIGEFMSLSSDIKVSFINDNILLSAKKLILGNNYEIHNVKTMRTFTPGTGHRFILNEALIKRGIIIDIDNDEQKIQLIKLPNGQKTTLQCTYENNQRAYLINDEKLGLLSKNHFCVINIASGEIHQVIKNNNSNEWFTAFVNNKSNGLDILTSTGKLIQTEPSKSWRENIKAARDLISYKTISKE